MKLGAIAPWYGSKRSLAPTIVEQLGEHRCYWEPFCGSMAVLLAKPPCSSETVNDVHGDLINLARVIRDPKLGAQLFRRLRRTWFGKPILDDARERLAELPKPESPSVDRAEAYFTDAWQSMNGLAGTASHAGQRGIARRFSSLGGDPAVRWMAAVDSIPAWSKRMRGVRIEQSCGIELCEKIEDRVGTVIYADPPYLEKHAGYLHDFTDEDHERLASALSGFSKTRVVVSYYEHDKLADLYGGDWTKIDCTMSKSVGRPGLSSGKAISVAPEILLVNGPMAGGGLW